MADKTAAVGGGAGTGAGGHCGGGRKGVEEGKRGGRRKETLMWHTAWSGNNRSLDHQLLLTRLAG